jgi:hypothetical protein
MNPYEPGDELDRADPTLDEVALRIESYATRSGSEPPADLASRIAAAIADEPVPASRWAWLSSWREPMRAVAAVAVLAAVIGGALLAGTLIDRARNVGSSPTPAVPSISPSPSSSPSLTPSPTASPSSSPSATPQPTVSVTPLPTVAPGTPVPPPSDDDDELETPEPSESDDDNSGPGGGGGSGSGSGSGGSGSGSDSSGSGSGGD